MERECQIVKNSDRPPDVSEVVSTLDEKPSVSNTVPKTQDVVSFVTYQVGLYKICEVSTLQTNQQLLEAFGLSKKQLRRRMGSLPAELKNYRRDILQSQQGKIGAQTRLANLTSEQRSEITRKRNQIHGNPLIGRYSKKELSIRARARIMALTPEERSELGKRGYAAHLARLTPEERSQYAKKGSKFRKARNLTKEQRSEISRKGVRTQIERYGGNFGGRITREQRVNIGKNSPVTKMTKEERIEAGKIGFRISEQAPNGLEGLFMDNLRTNGLLAEAPDKAMIGQVYYAGFRKNKWYCKFENGRHKLPDFKVKGVKKVIEIFGNYHHSKEFCERTGKRDYDWIPERLTEEYAKVGIECKVFWEHEIRNPKRLAEIMQEIKDWVKEN